MRSFILLKWGKNKKPECANRRHKIIKIIAPLAIFLFAFSVYLFTIAPSIYLEDSAEFVIAAFTLGVPHPPGFPLYVLIGHLFTLLIPSAEIALRLNIMSAFFGALTGSILFLVIAELLNIALGQDKGQVGKGSPPAYSYKASLLSFFVCLTFIFSFTFWSQSVIAEVYTLNCFFVVLLIWLIVKWKLALVVEDVRSASLYFYFFSFSYGLSLTNHTMMILLAPAFIFYILAAGGRWILRNYKSILLSPFLFFAPLAVYLYLPVASLGQPALDWGNVQSFPALWRHIIRAEYADFGLSSAGSKIDMVKTFFTNLPAEFSFWLILAASVGCLFLFVRHTFLAVFLCAIFIGNSLLIILLRSYGWGMALEHIYSVYYLPSYLAIVIGVAFFWYFILGVADYFLRTRRVIIKKFLLLIIWLLITAAPLSLMVKNFDVNNRANFWLTHQWSEILVAGLEPNAILVIKSDGLTGDAQVFAVGFALLARQIRPDVLFIDDSNFTRKPNGWALPEDYYRLNAHKKFDYLLEYYYHLARLLERPLYSIVPVDNALLTSRSNGLAHKVFPRGEAPPHLQSVYALDLSRERIYSYSHIAKDFLASYLYSQAVVYLEKCQSDYLSLFFQAISFDMEPFSGEYQRFINHRANINCSHYAKAPAIGGWR